LVYTALSALLRFGTSAAFRGGTVRKELFFYNLACCLRFSGRSKQRERFMKNRVIALFLSLLMIVGLTPSFAAGVNAADGTYQLLEISSAVYDNGVLTVEGKGIAVSDNITVALIIYTGVTNVSDPVGTAKDMPTVFNLGYADIRTSGDTSGSTFKIQQTVTAEAFSSTGMTVVGLKTINNPDTIAYKSVSSVIRFDANGDMDFDTTTTDANTQNGAVVELTAPIGSSYYPLLPTKAGDVPTRTHYGFSKWLYANGTAVPTSAVMPVEGVTLYADWAATTFYNIKFTAGENGYLVGGVQLRVPYGSTWADAVAALPTPTPVNSNYKHAYWYPEIPADDYIINSDLSFNAVFTPVNVETSTHISINKAEYKDGYITITGTVDAMVQPQWDIAFRIHANVANQNDVFDSSVTVIHNTVKFSDIQTSGNSFSYTFKADKTYLTGSVYAVAKLINVDFDQFASAPLTTPIAFTAGVGGSLSGTTSFDVPFGADFSTITIPAPVANGGYSFIGWNPALPATADNSYTFTAMFQKNVAMPFDITSAIYNPATGKLTVEGYAENAQDQWHVALMVYSNVADSASVVKGNLVSSATLTYGDIKTENGYFKAELTAHEASLTGNVYVYGKYVAVGSAPDAQRVQTYLYFDKNAEDAVAGATTETLVYINDDITASLTADEPTRANYKFIGWAADANGTAIAADAKMPAGGYTAYANWERDVFTITFTADANGTLSGTTTVTAQAGSSFADVIIPTPVANDGYYFVTWTPAFPETVEGDYTFKAVFEKSVEMPFDITSAIYDPATGKLTVEGYAENAQDQWHVALMVYSNVADSASVVKGNLVSFTTLTYGEIKTEDGYFKAELTAHEASLTGNVYVYGKYVEVASVADTQRVQTYLYFDKNAEDAVAGATTETLVYINDSVKASLTIDYPTRDGYVFGTWAADAEGTAISDDAVVTAGGCTVYAQWIKEDVEVSYRFVAPKQWYVVNEPLATDYKLYRVLEDGTELLVDQALYTVDQLPTTDTASYEECIGYHGLHVTFEDTAYGETYKTSFSAFVIPDKLILEETSPLDRVAPDNLGKAYTANVTNALDADLLFNLKERTTATTLINEFINLYFINYYTTPDDIDCVVRVVNADGSAYTSRYVGTGAKVQLVINGVVYDEVQVVVLGDTNGDGMLNESDLEVIRNYRNGGINLVGAYYLAADTRDIAKINESDLEAIRKYRNGETNLYEDWDYATHVYTRNYDDLVYTLELL